MKILVRLLDIREVAIISQAFLITRFSRIKAETSISHTWLASACIPASPPVLLTVNLVDLSAVAVAHAQAFRDLAEAQGIVRVDHLDNLVSLLIGDSIISLLVLPCYFHLVLNEIMALLLFRFHSLASRTHSDMLEIYNYQNQPV